MTLMKKVITLIVLFIGVSTVSFAWEITPDGVDSIVLGKPIPSTVMEGEKAPYDKVAADYLPLKGFFFKNPPIIVARKGAKVSHMIIEDQNVMTKEGIGVGTTLKKLNRTYQNVVFHAVPPTFGDDEAVAVARDMPNVKFYFKDVKSARAGGKVVRIMIFKE